MLAIDEVEPLVRDLTGDMLVTVSECDDYLFFYTEASINLDTLNEIKDQTGATQVEVAPGKEDDILIILRREACITKA